MFYDEYINVHVMAIMKRIVANTGDSFKYYVHYNNTPFVKLVYSYFMAII